MVEPKAKRPAVDWEAMEPDWRAGIKSPNQLAKEYGVSRPAILKHWEKEGVERDLSEKIKAKTDSLVTHATVTPLVTPETKASEKKVIEVTATMLAEKILGQRADVTKARTIVQKLWDMVDAELNHPDELKKLGAMLAAPDEFGNDKLNDMYFAALGLPQQVKNVKLLADSLKVLIELERKVLRLDEQKPAEVNPLAELIRAVSGTALPIAQHVSDDDNE